MSICNMSKEGGARAGMIAPDETTFEYLKNRSLAPKYEFSQWKKALNIGLAFQTDPGAKFDIDIFIDAKDIALTMTWAKVQKMLCRLLEITGSVPDDQREEGIWSPKA